jgi:hypothetical protein
MLADADDMFDPLPNTGLCRTAAWTMPGTLTSMPKMRPGV